MKFVQQSRGDVGGAVTFFHQATEQLFLLLVLAFFQNGPQANQSGVGACFLDLGGGGNLTALNPHAGEALDLLKQEDFPTRDEGDGLTTPPGTTSAPDAVNIIFAVVGEIVVENNFDVIDVDAAGSDIGGYEKFKIGPAKAGHDPIAHGLAHTAVEAVGGIALGIEMFGQVIDHLLGIAENDTQLEIVDID